jgi:hypothetical protein
MEAVLGEFVAVADVDGAEGFGLSEVAVTLATVSQPGQCGFFSVTEP